MTVSTRFTAVLNVRLSQSLGHHPSSSATSHESEKNLVSKKTAATSALSSFSSWPYLVKCRNKSRDLMITLLFQIQKGCWGLQWEDDGWKIHMVRGQMFLIFLRFFLVFLSFGEEEKRVRRCLFSGSITCERQDLSTQLAAAAI